MRKLDSLHKALMKVRVFWSWKICDAVVPEAGSFIGFTPSTRQKYALSGDAFAKKWKVDIHGPCSSSSSNIILIFIMHWILSYCSPIREIFSFP
jgi:hypothetical protein